VEAATARTARPRRASIAIAAAIVCAGGAAWAWSAPPHHRAQAAVAGGLRPHPRVVVALDPGAQPPAAATVESEPQRAAAAPSDAQIRGELAAFRRELRTVTTVRGAPGRVLADGSAVVPFGAPAAVAAVIAAGNQIATKPYKWGGGHGGWSDTGYDCSGSVSFALAGAGLLDAPLDSTGFMSWGDPGPGHWISIYASPQHVFMAVGDLRFDTSGAQGGTRWQPPQRSTAGFAVRHPPGL
jgi:cell wall-associated NlpC family hydrolase